MAADAVLDPARIAAVRSTGLLDAAAQDWADELTALAARLLRAPLAFLTLVDETRSFWFSCQGLEDGSARENTVEQSFCQYVVADRRPLIVEDAAVHERTRANPSVTGMGVRAWAGHPLLDADGQALGSFCVVDTVPRTWTVEDLDTLGVLARATSTQITLLSAVTAEREAIGELATTRAVEHQTSIRLDRLAGIALDLVSCETVEDLAESILHRGLAILSADGGAVFVRGEDDDDDLRLAFSEVSRSSGERSIRSGTLPADHPLPGAETARTGERIVLANRAEALARTPEIEGTLDWTDRNAWVVEPLRVEGRLLGSLVISWVDERELSDADLNLTAALAAQCAQALGRIVMTETQRSATLELYHLAESLQRSLLMQPPVADDLVIAVRYLPAAKAAEVGGDWHDAFTCGDGSTVLSIGDVCGHDREAAAVMAQVRNLLRGLAIDGDDDPASLLVRLDRAMVAFEIETFATAIIGKVSGPAGDRALCFSNAGHPPPVLCGPDGVTTVVDGLADLPLAVGWDDPRSDHRMALPPGSTFVLYTDGLVERRHEGIDARLELLRSTVAAAHGSGADAVCDEVRRVLLPSPPEDDVALIVIQTL